jgi:hypothetical protein
VLVNGYLRNVAQFNDIMSLSAGTRYHFAVSNATTGTINVVESAGRSFFVIEQIDSVPAASD